MPDPMPETPVLEMRGICKNYDALSVLKGVSLAAMPGEVISLIGSSGLSLIHISEPTRR